MNREGGARGHAVFGPKLLNTQRSVRRCTPQSPIMKWANVGFFLKKKNSLKPNAASHNNTSWCTDADGFLEHSPSGGSLFYKGPTLQKIILGFGGSPSYIFANTSVLGFRQTPRRECRAARQLQSAFFEEPPLCFRGGGASLHSQPQ